MAGLLQGNPYYSGPDAGAAGVNAFADNLMKSYGFFAGQDRENQQQKIQNQLAQIKINEAQNQEKMRQEIQAYQAQGLMAPAGGPQQPMPQLNDFGGGMGAGSMGQPMAQPGMGVPMTGPAMQADPSLAIPESAAPQRSELESLQGMMAIVSKYDPEKGMQLRAQLQSATSKQELNAALLDFKIAAQEAKQQYGQQIMDLKTKMADDAVSRAEEAGRHNLAIETLRAMKGNGGEQKTTEFDRDYKDYSDWYDKSPSPNSRKFTRGEYRDYQMRMQAGAKTQGQMEGIRGSMGTPSPSTPSRNPQYNPKTGKIE